MSNTKTCLLASGIRKLGSGDNEIMEWGSSPYNLTLTFYSWRLHLQLKIIKWCSSLKLILLNKKKNMSHKLVFSTEIIFCSKLKTQSINITGYNFQISQQRYIITAALFDSNAEVYDALKKKKMIKDAKLCISWLFAN